MTDHMSYSYAQAEFKLFLSNTNGRCHSEIEEYLWGLVNIYVNSQLYSYGFLVFLCLSGDPGSGLEGSCKIIKTEEIYGNVFFMLSSLL